MPKLSPRALKWAIAAGIAAGGAILAWLHSLPDYTSWTGSR